MLGKTASGIMAPIAGAVARARKSRVFHPRGIAMEARASIVSESLIGGVLRVTSQPEALLRFSSALWKERVWPDVLGIGLRWGGQDILFATIYAPALTPAGPLHTKFWDFDRNTYYAVSPFDCPDGIRGYLRIRLKKAAPSKREISNRKLTRREKFLDELPKTYVLERNTHRWLGRWEAIAEFELLRESNVDQEALRFSPFRSGLGFKPRGFTHALRTLVYPASQAARPVSERDRAGSAYAPPAQSGFIQNPTVSG